ncbi:MAG: hypothetical protein IAE82_06510 [Opitutaceae bacterium]|nr:hypothetical protein [Opitutaceae bacterium]
MKVNIRIGSGPVGFVGLLTIVFVTLRLLGRIDWSWWWVLSPLWITAALSLLILGAVLFIAALDR